MKKKTIKHNKDRQAQFERIAALKQAYQATQNPIISMDTKKKEPIGLLFRPGTVYSQGAIHAYDHDFWSLREGVAIPHGIYDLRKNTGYISIGTSKDTGAFACDSLRNWWYHQGQYDYPHATSILILCDSGGSNDARHYLFKADLQKLADELDIEIRIAHYPPYCSKYNPIEHRLFPHVTRACQGVLFRSHQDVLSYMAKTQTRTGLSVTVELIDKVYETGRQVDPDFKLNNPIHFDDTLSKWNYRAVPSA